MESHLIRTSIFDFYGIPGSGKTTKAHALAEQYRSIGKSVVEPSFALDHNRSVAGRRIKKLWITAKFFFLYHKAFKSIRTLVARNNYSKKNGSAIQIVNISTKLYSIIHYNGLFDYIIFDEGVAQAAISLSVNSMISAADNLGFLLSFIEELPEYHLVQVKTNITDALERVETRQSKDTRIEMLKTKQERIEWMERYNKASEQISRMPFSQDSVKNY